ncbi:MAG: phytoene/squalene synthase family protein [Fimbriimonadales bacterium]|nr:phytoene/squalene synthase family protein [Fimbriimonadales bacterium]
MERDYAHCQSVQRAYGVSYYFATRFFPPEIRRAVYALYGFVRYPDQWVDCPEEFSAVCVVPSPPQPPAPPTRARGESSPLSHGVGEGQGVRAGTPLAHGVGEGQGVRAGDSPLPRAGEGQGVRAKLDSYERDFIRAVCGEPVELPPLRAFADVVRRYKIPLRYPLAFLDAMRMDLERTRYATFEELQNYTWGSASVVGVMLCYIFGATAPETLRYASTMGLAMQMTNFLRDVGEDWQRGRVYLPQDELAQFGISEAQIAQGVVDERWRAFMRFQIDRCRALYAEAEQGIPLLPRAVQYPVLLGSRLYARILNAIERNDYEVFRQRARTTYAEKVQVAVLTYSEWRYNIITNRSASRV